MQNFGKKETKDIFFYFGLVIDTTKLRVMKKTSVSIKWPTANLFAFHPILDRGQESNIP
jgi:hypothetical protein